MRPNWKTPILLAFTLIIIITSSTGVLAQGPPDNPGNFNGNQDHGSKKPSRYQFGSNLSFELQAQAGVNFSISYDETVSNRFLGLNINNTENISIQIDYSSQFEHPVKSPIRKGNNLGKEISQSPDILYKKDDEVQSRFDFINNIHDVRVSQPLKTPFSASNEEYLSLDSDFHFDTYFTITLEPDKLQNLEVYTHLNYSDFGSIKDLSNYLWVIYDLEKDEWYSLDTEIIENGILFTLNSDEVEIPEVFTISVIKLPESSIFPPVGTNLFWFIVIGIIIVALLFGILMSPQEYRQFLLNRVLHIDKGAHRLSMEDVLENENRTKIIDLILYEPGIHFNELLRKTGLSAGNLAWHLDILETFKIIRKQRMGQYLVYYPYYEKNPVAKLDPAVQKSRTTLEIMQIIHDHPGIFQKQIAHRLDLDHKTVKYHIDKLMDAGIIVSEKSGRKTLYYPADLVDEN